MKPERLLPCICLGQNDFSLRGSEKVIQAAQLPLEFLRPGLVDGARLRSEGAEPAITSKTSNSDPSSGWVSLAPAC
jgi:hypothetical protein